jgi:DNA-binding transcriptional LysR family regulator
MIDLVQLRTFVAVAEELHLTRAAERLHISQSAASAHVRAVEERLNAQLFVRTSRNLELTRAGQLLMQKAKVLLNEAALFTSYARELHGKIVGHILIGSSSDPATSRIGRIVAALRERHPLVSVDLRTCPSSGIRQGLKTGELDVGFLLGSAVDANFSYYEIKNVLFRVVGPVAWKQQIEEADWTALARLPWITSTDSSMAYTAMLKHLFEERGLEPNTVATFDNAILGRSMLEAGVGLMLMREEHAKQSLARGTLAASAIARAEMPIYMVHLTSRRNDPLICAILQATTDVWPELRTTPAGSATMPTERVSGT